MIIAILMKENFPKVNFMVSANMCIMISHTWINTEESSKMVKEMALVVRQGPGCLQMSIM